VDQLSLEDLRTDKFMKILEALPDVYKKLGVVKVRMRDA
jgi:hypothetical protein